MIEIAVAIVLIVHGFVHARVWMPAYSADTPNSGPNPNHSWLLGDVRGLAVALALLAAVGLMTGGIGYLSDQNWWTAVTIGGGAVSLALIGLYFNRWLSLGAVISAATIAYAVMQAA
jgi:hypothetical protein